MQIYIITNKINGKIYIGQDSKDDPNYFGSGIVINKAIKKYGRENFIKDILQECNSKDEMNSAEIFWISEFNSNNSNIGYNLSPGGDGGATRTGAILDSVLKEKIRAGINKYYTLHPEAKENLSNKMTGKFVGDKNPMYKQGHKVAGEKNGRYGGKGTTDETRKKISDANTGRKHSDETKKLRSEQSKGTNNPMYGRSAYDIWVERYGQEEADKRKEEVRLKKSKAGKGKKKSEETKQKMREAALMRYMKITMDNENIIK